MFRPLLRVAVLLFVTLGAVSALSAASADYKSAIVMDAATGEILFEDNADYITPPASVTKLMTFLIVEDAIRAGKLTLQTQVQIQNEDAKIGGTQVWLDPRESFPVEELLYALMIQSANDAANALARATAGSREAFVRLMNERAQALGMTHTTWRSPHGLPPSNRKFEDSDQTTARDLALLSRELIFKTDVMRYTSVRLRKFGEGIRKAENVISMKNHNNLLTRVPGMDGLKTGFTNGAGFCLAATVARDDRRIIAVMMGSPTSKIRDARMAGLIEEYFPKTTPMHSAAPAAGTATSANNGLQITPMPVEPHKETPPAAPAKEEDEDLPTVSFPSFKKKP